MENEYKYDRLLLKWGTLKGHRFQDPECQSLIREYYKDGVSMSVALQKDTPKQKEILLELIDKCQGTIKNDWDGEEYSKEKAKDYILNYGTKY